MNLLLSDLALNMLIAGTVRLDLPSIPQPVDVPNIPYPTLHGAPQSRTVHLVRTRPLSTSSPSRQTLIYQPHVPPNPLSATPPAPRRKTCLSHPSESAVEDPALAWKLCRLNDEIMILVDCFSECNTPDDDTWGKRSKKLLCMAYC